MPLQDAVKRSEFEGLQCTLYWNNRLRCDSHGVVINENVVGGWNQVPW